MWNVTKICHQDERIASTYFSSISDPRRESPVTVSSLPSLWSLRSEVLTRGVSGLMDDSPRELCEKLELERWEIVSPGKPEATELFMTPEEMVVCREPVNIPVTVFIRPVIFVLTVRLALPGCVAVAEGTESTVMSLWDTVYVPPEPAVCPGIPSANDGSTV